LSDSPIGIFDSGIGGLTVVKEIRRILPNENIVYLGDTARLPYGTKSIDAIIEFSLENTEFLISRGAKFIIIACYSSTSVALDIVRKNVNVPVIGVIQPGVEKAVELTKNHKVGVVGTSLTIYSGAYEKAFRDLDERCEVLGKACPLFVSLVEEGWLDHPATDLIAQTYLKPLKDDNVDTVLLGCTHFPLLMPVFRKIMGKINYVDASREVGSKVADELRRLELQRDAKNGTLMIYLTDLSMNFKEIGERFLSEPMKNFSRVALKGS
jgi:glutamate racemase